MRSRAKKRSAVLSIALSDQRILTPLVTAAAFLLLGFAPESPAQEWTRFRGPNGTGISQTKTVPTKISETDLNWKIDLPGGGHSSPVLWGERTFSPARAIRRA